MGAFVQPRAYLVAETKVDSDAMGEALQHLGVTNWSTDAETDADLLSEFAGKSCYMSFDTSLNANLTRVGGRNNHDYLQEGIIGQKHGSVLEHSTVSFFIVDVSRVVTHEIVRHRAGTAFSQSSGRYVRNPDIDMYLPETILNLPTNTAGEMVGVYRRAMAQMEANIAELAELADIDDLPFELKKKLTSAFRRIVGNGQANNILVTANHRAWRHMIEMRTHPSAEEEIRIVFADISKQLREKFPNIYADAEITVEDDIEVTTFANSKV